MYLKFLQMQEEKHEIKEGENDEVWLEDLLRSKGPVRKETKYDIDKLIRISQLESLHVFLLSIYSGRNIEIWGLLQFNPFFKTKGSFFNSMQVPVETFRSQHGQKSFKICMYKCHSLYNVRVATTLRRLHDFDLQLVRSHILFVGLSPGQRKYLSVRFIRWNAECGIGIGGDTNK